MAQATLEGAVEITGAFLEHAYACTMCGSCEAHCPVGLPLNEIFHAWRVDLAAEGHAHPSHQRMATLMQKHLNPYGPRWEEPVKRTAPASIASILFYPGCTTNRMAVETVQAVTELLGKLDLDFALYEEDTCCGFPLYEVGQVDQAKEIAQATLKRLQAQRPEVLLTTCPACYETFRFLLPEAMGLPVDFEVVHISEFLLPYLKDAVLSPRESPTTVTWHDPCVLGRHLGMYEQPREVLRAIPGLELVEMISNRENALCCGAGGGVYFACQQMANQAVVNRLEQALETQAKMIVTSCPNCYVRFRQMSRHHRLEIQARSLSQVINDALP
jgi:heterodisulfide reductase subunit D